MIARFVVFLSAAALSTAAAAEPLTIRVGESWTFSVKDGQPAGARRVKAADKPARGRIKATLTGLGGTSLTLTNNSPTSYSFKARLIGVSAGSSARTCTLPANGKPALEYWPQKASAVRIGDFTPTAADGTCPQPGS